MIQWDSAITWCKNSKELGVKGHGRHCRSLEKSPSVELLTTKHLILQMHYGTMGHIRFGQPQDSHKITCLVRFPPRSVSRASKLLGKKHGPGIFGSLVADDFPVCGDFSELPSFFAGFQSLFPLTQ